MAEQETKRKRSQQMVSEVIDGQRLPFLLTAAAQHPFVQSLLIFTISCIVQIIVLVYLLSACIVLII